MLSIAFLTVYALGKRGSKSLKLQAELARKQYLKEKKAIQEAHDKEIALRNEAQERYSEAVRKIEEKYEESKKLISHAKKEEVKKMIKRQKTIPTKLTKF